MSRFKKLHVVMAIVIIALLLSFKAKEQAYQIDAKQCKVHWLAKKTTGQHEGDVPLKSGILKTDGSTPLSGEFVLDINAITCTDIEDADDNKDLVNHLKNDDFFSAAKYPTALLTVKKFDKLAKASKGESNYTATADLTIKSVKREIQFPVTVDITDALVNANAKITIDRTKWDIVYKSKTVFGTLGDKFIYDDINFDVKLVLKK